MKPHQRYIVGVIFALAVFLASVLIARTMYQEGAFALGTTWPTWVVALLVLAGLEYWLFRDWLVQRRRRRRR